MAVNSRLVFIADDGVHGNELWASDGTTTGTYLVKDINPGSGSSFLYGAPPDEPDNLIVAGDRVFFSATDGTTGFKAWISDGTADGTFQLTDADLVVPRHQPTHVLDVDGPGARSIVRLGNEDMFRQGSSEAYADGYRNGYAEGSQETSSSSDNEVDGGAW